VTPFRIAPEREHNSHFILLCNATLQSDAEKTVFVTMSPPQQQQYIDFALDKEAAVAAASADAEAEQTKAITQQTNRAAAAAATAALSHEDLQVGSYTLLLLLFFMCVFFIIDPFIESQ
jgi:hypothetical protein